MLSTLTEAAIAQRNGIIREKNSNALQMFYLEKDT